MVRPSHVDVGNGQEERRLCQRVSRRNQRLNDANMFRLGLDGRVYEFLGVFPVEGDQDAAVVFAIKSTLGSLRAGANVPDPPTGVALGGGTGFGFGFGGGLCLGSRGPMSSSRPRRSGCLCCFAGK